MFMLLANSMLCLTLPTPAVVRSQEPAVQDEPELAARKRVQVELRVSAVLDPTRATIDRGARDGLELGDELVLLPRTGGRYRARVVDLAERSATIEVVDLGLRPTAGMRGETWLPARRFDAAPEREAGEPASEGQPYEWNNPDADWEPGMSLLAGMRPPRPAERDPLLRGRAFTAFDAIRSDEGGRSSTLLRAGTDLSYENLTGRGDTLRLLLEWDQRNFDLPDQPDVERQRLRVERLSYLRGGTRFDPVRLEFGRFLQHGLPAFGLLDGVEWSQRSEGGHGYGASAGWMPEPDWRQATGQDFQVAAWARWLASAREELSAAVGYQRTWHNGAADRDLIVLESRYLPREGWRLSGTLWIDVYSSGDEAKGSGPELTQAQLGAWRDFEGRFGLGLTYAHLAFPELDREEFFPPVLADQLAEDFVDRIGLDAWWEALREGRWTGRVGFWNDQDESGGDVELGLELRERLGRGTRLCFALFAVDGRFVEMLGARAGLGWVAGRAQGDLLYEFANHTLEGFSAENDELPQHRVRASLGWQPAPAYSASLYVEGIDRDTDRSAALGVFLQWLF